MRTGQNKRAGIMYAFLLSILYVLFDAAVYVLLVGPLHTYLPIRPQWLENLVHLILLSSVGTALGCMSFWVVREDPSLVPKGYSFLPVYLVIFYLYPLLSVDDAAMRDVLLRLITLYALAPAILGPAISWTVYRLRYRGPDKKKKR